MILMKFDQTLNRSNKTCQGHPGVYEISPTLSCLEFWRNLDRNRGRWFDVLAALAQQALGSEHQTCAGNHLV